MRLQVESTRCSSSYTNLRSSPTISLNLATLGFAPPPNRVVASLACLDPKSGGVVVTSLGGVPVASIFSGLAAKRVVS